MPQTQWVIILILILSLTVHTVKSDSPVIVEPTGSDPSICGDHAVCDTLANLISNNMAVFSDSENSIFEFRKGRHEVSVKETTHLLVSVTGALTWQGSELGDTTINCKRPLVFVFLNIKSLTLRNLNFLECGHSLPSLHFISQYESEITRASAAVALLNLTSFHMQSVTISQSRGYGLLGLNLWGKNNISSSHFLGNNAETEYSADECTGGNAAFYFYYRKLKSQNSRTVQKQREEVTLLITHSTFQDGADWSDKSYTSLCSELYDKSASHPVFRANGLAIIAGQKVYQVTIQVTDTNFSQNTGNGLHPAVWVHDYGGVADNRFEFINCHFKREGTLRISSLENKNCSGKQNNVYVCYIKNRDSRLNHHPFTHVQVVNCSFASSPHSALEICAKPTYVRYNMFQLISIINSTFENYEPNNKTKSSVIIIEYITSHHKYPSIALKIIQNRFVSNKIPSLVCKLGQDTYAETNYKNKYSYQKIIDLKYNIFRDNFHVNGSTVLFKTPFERSIPIWKYENSTNKYGKMISRVNFSRCCFRNNTAGDQQGILRIENTYVILNNSTFESSQGTALYALKSVIHIEGVNLFNGNSGTLGGALNLNMSRIFVTSDSFTQITDNTAVYGGGIYALADLTIKRETNGICTISYDIKDDMMGKIELARNKAKYAGHSIFGGIYNHCGYVCSKKSNVLSCSSNATQVLRTVLHVSGDANSDLEIVCLPAKLLACKNDQRKVYYRNRIQLSAFPGETFTVTLTAMDDLNQTSKAVVAGTMCKTDRGIITAAQMTTEMISDMVSECRN